MSKENLKYNVTFILGCIWIVILLVVVLYMLNLRFEYPHLTETELWLKGIENFKELFK